MRFRRSLAALTLALPFTLGACDDIIGNDATIVVENNASASVFRVFIRDCGESDWGDDELGPSETIAPGDDRSFGVDEGCYDLLAEFSDDTFADEFDVEVEDGDEFTWELVD